MAGRPARVAAVVRHREAVLCCRTPAVTGSLTLPAVPVSGADPESALRPLLAGLGLGPARIERRGEPVGTGAEATMPFLVSVDGRDVAATDACPDPTWGPPARLLRQDDGRPWQRYAAVAPTVETVASDTARGSTAIATDALWALRDAAAEAAAHGDGWTPVERVATDLLGVRPSMAALGNRVDRAMAGAETPAAVERAATEGIVRAFEADEAAARLAAETIDGGRALTLSRSGTVRAALLEARPAVVVLASRPGGEGLAVAESLADAGLAVESCADAAVYDRLRAGDVAAVLVGADAVTPDGAVVNKVGTRAAALAAESAGVPCYAVCASDKIQPLTAEAPPVRFPVDPMLGLTPAAEVTALLTERGRLPTDEVAAIAAAHRELQGWRR